MKKLLILLLGLLLIPAVYSASSGITLVTPSASEIISGSAYNFSATLTRNDEDTGNITIYYSIDSGATWIIFASAVNISANESCFSVTADTTSLDDGNANYTWNATANNGDTEGEAIVVDDLSDTSLTVSVDNNAPLVELELAHPFIRKGGLVQIATCTLTDIVDSSLTTTQVLTKPDASTESVTESQWYIPKTQTLMPDTSDGYSVNCSTIDDEGNTNSTTKTFSVLSEKDREEDIERKDEEIRKTNIGMIVMIGIISFVVVGGLVTILILKKQGKL